MTDDDSTDSRTAQATAVLARAARRYGANLAAGARLALPLPARGIRLSVSLGQLLALILTLAAASALDDLADAGWPATFSVWGLLSWATISYFWLAALAAVAVATRQETGYLGVAVAMAAVLVFQFTAWSLLKHASRAFEFAPFETHYVAIWSAFLAWEVIAFARVLALRGGRRLWRVAVPAACYGAAMYAVLTLLPHSGLFIAQWEPTTWEQPDVEATYYAQPNLLRQSLYALSPQRPGRVDLYFVGFAAYAHQDVFQREIEQASVIFEQQFDAIGRTLTLINNPKTLDAVPLANRHNLEHAVRGLAERIDPAEDIVVMFLSSHGDDDATIAVDLDGFGLNDLSARDVREILDENDIEWRIVIVSACYSGSFIEALAGPRTLVMTAAASDRSSFGCAHENDWTYFGEAYFGHALKTTASFVDAFELAAERISAREADEGKEASQPQISLGAEIADYLRRHAL